MRRKTNPNVTKDISLSLTNWLCGQDCTRSPCPAISNWIKLLNTYDNSFIYFHSIMFLEASIWFPTYLSSTFKLFPWMPFDKAAYLILPRSHHVCTDIVIFPGSILPSWRWRHHLTLIRNKTCPVYEGGNRRVVGE